MSEYDVAKLVKRNLEAELKATSDALEAATEGKMYPNGLVTDECKATEEYKAAKKANNLAFEQLRAFNGAFMKKYKKEMMAERRNR